MSEHDSPAIDLLTHCAHLRLVSASGGSVMSTILHKSNKVRRRVFSFYSLADWISE